MKHIFDTLKEFILFLQDIINNFILMQYYLHQLNDQLLQLHRIFQA